MFGHLQAPYFNLECHTSHAFVVVTCRRTVLTIIHCLLSCGQLPVCLNVAPKHIRRRGLHSSLYTKLFVRRWSVWSNTWRTEEACGTFHMLLWEASFSVYVSSVECTTVVNTQGTLPCVLLLLGGAVLRHEIPRFPCLWAPRFDVSSCEAKRCRISPRHYAVCTWNPHIMLIPY